MRKKIEKYTALCCVLVPFLQYYGWSFFNLAFVLVFFLMLYIWKKQGHITFENVAPMVCYFIYYCITRFLYGFLDVGMIAPSMIFMFLYWSFLNRYLCFDKFINYYRIAAFINIVFFIVQEISYKTTGIRMVGIMTFLPLTLGDGGADITELVDKMAEAERSSAFFSEPAHFVQFLLPLLSIELLFFTGKKALIRSIVYVLTLLALSSGNALIGLLVVFVFFLIKILIQNKTAISIFFVSVMMAGAIVFVNYISHSEYGQKLIDRQEQLAVDQTEATSGFVRIYRGYFIYDEMTPVQKLFGVNSNKILDVLIKKSRVSHFFEDGDQYLNSVQSFLIFTGYIGTFLFAFGCLCISLKNNLAGICCIFMYVALSFISSNYFTYTMVLYMACAILMKKEKVNVKVIRYTI